MRHARTGFYSCTLAACLLGPAAHAQGSVVLYGLLDTGVSYANHVASSSGGSSSVLKLADGVYGGSRWGIRGAEDLGAGYSAVFTLENGFSITDGTISQGGALFGRQAFVGIRRRGAGTLTLGRQYSFSHDYLNAYSTTGLTAANGYAGHINAVDQLNSSRLNNSVKFSSETFNGLKFGGMYAFSNQAGAFGGSASDKAAGDAGSSRAYSFGASWQAGNFGIGFAYTDISYPLAAVPAFKLTLANVSPGGQRNLRTFGIGSRYRFGPALVYGLWTNTRFVALDHSASTFNTYEGGVVYSMTGLLSAGLGFTRSQLSGSASGAWNQINSSLQYQLSKRTCLYLLAIYQKASGSNDGIPVQAQIGKSASYFGPSGSGSQSQLALRIGMQHRF